MLCIHGPNGLSEIVESECRTFLDDYLSRTFDIFLLEIAGYFCLEQYNRLCMFDYADILLLLFFSLVEQPLASIGQVVVIQQEGPSALLSREVAAEAVVELVDVLFISEIVLVGCHSIEGELIEHDLYYLLVILGLILLSGRRIGLILLWLLLLLIVLLLFFLRRFLLFLCSLFLCSLFLRLGPRLTLLNLDPNAQQEDTRAISEQRSRLVEID